MYLISPDRSVGFWWWELGWNDGMLKMKPLGVMDVLIVFCGAGFTGICVCRVLSNCTLLKINVLSEKAMAPHCSTLAWKIPWMEEPGGLLSMVSHRVGHDWSDLAAAAVYYLSVITINKAVRQYLVHGNCTVNICWIIE